MLTSCISHGFSQMQCTLKAAAFKSSIQSCFQDPVLPHSAFHSACLHTLLWWELNMNFSCFQLSTFVFKFNLPISFNFLLPSFPHLFWSIISSIAVIFLSFIEVIYTSFCFLEKTSFVWVLTTQSMTHHGESHGHGDLGQLTPLYPQLRSRTVNLSAQLTWLYSGLALIPGNSAAHGKGASSHLN